MKASRTITNMLTIAMLFATFSIVMNSCTSDKKAEEPQAEETMTEDDASDSDTKTDNKGASSDDSGTSDNSETVMTKTPSYHTAIEAHDPAKLKAVKYSGEPLTIAEHWPYFGNCAQRDGSPEVKKKCSIGAFTSAVGKMIKYPPAAKDNGAEGRVVVEVVVAEDGSVESSKVVSDKVGFGAAEEALRVVNEAGNWSPAEHNGQPVKFKMYLPINYRLDS